MEQQSSSFPTEGTGTALEPAPVNGEIEFAVMFNAAGVNISPHVAEAQMAIATKSVPLRAIKTRQGRGGKVLQYIDHIFATETIQKGLLQTWSFDIVSYEIFEDKSVLAIVKFTYLVPYNNAGKIDWITRSITEAGNYVNDMKLPGAPAVAAAASRGLVRCLMRMFGFGIQFYKGGEEEETPEMAWTTVEKFAKDNKIPIQDVFNLMDQMGISKSNIVDRFSEFFTAVGDLVSGNTLSPFPERAAQVLANDPAPQTASSENVVDPDPEAVSAKVAPPVWTTWKDLDQIKVSIYQVGLDYEKVKVELAKVSSIFDIANAPEYFNIIKPLIGNPEYTLLPIVADGPPFEPDPVPAPSAYADYKDFGDISAMLTAAGKGSDDELTQATADIQEKFGLTWNSDAVPMYAQYLHEIYKLG